MTVSLILYFASGKSGTRNEKETKPKFILMSFMKVSYNKSFCF